MVFSNVIVDITIFRRPFVFSQSYVQISASLTNVRGLTIVETSVIVTNNSSFQNYTNPDDHIQQTTDTPGFKPFTVLRNDVTQSVKKATRKKNPSSPNRSRSYDLLVTNPDALPLSYRRLVEAKAIKLGPCDKRPTYC